MRRGVGGKAWLGTRRAISTRVGRASCGLAAFALLATVVCAAPAGASPSSRPTRYQSPATGTAHPFDRLPAVSAPGHERGSWRVLPTPNPTVPMGLLASVACPKAGACLGVGFRADDHGGVAPLAEVGDGTGWRLVAALRPAGSPYAILNRVACFSTRACTAVGFYYDAQGAIRSLAERWDGSSWAIQPTPNPTASVAGGLLGVSCPSAVSCIAVGSYNDSAGTPLTLAEVWNGSAWSILQSPDPTGAAASSLSSVSCSAVGTCLAVGGYQDQSQDQLTLSEAWDGSAWRLLSTPDPTGSTNSRLEAVSCPKPGACAAVGYSFEASGSQVTLAEAWNGSAWSIQSMPHPARWASSYLEGVSCRSAIACTAVGVYGSNQPPGSAALAESWDGSRWSVQVTPSPRAFSGSGLFGVSCPGSSSCGAVGDFTVGSQQGERVLAEAWDGAAWRIQRAPSLPGAILSQLSGVSCPSAAACVAVGNYQPNALTTLALAESWNGKAWSLQSVPDPKGSPSVALAAVSCPSGATCIATGSYIVPAGTQDGSGEQSTLAEAWDGSAWRILPMPNPSGAAYSVLNGVSCSSSTSCVAVGYYSTSTGPQIPFSETWDGDTWSIQPVAPPAGASSGALRGVSCLSAAACEAVGTFSTSKGRSSTLAEVWNGSSWAVQKTPSPQGAQGLELSGVSCSSADACTAAGDYYGTTAPATLAERWDGRSWSIQPTPTPTGQEVMVSGVSCAFPSACTVVGFYLPSDFGSGIAFAEGWNGSDWKLEAVPSPAGSTYTDLAGVSCLSSGACAATGFFTGMAGGSVTLAEIKA